MTTAVHEVAPDVFRLSTYDAAGGLQFNQFLVRDEQPLLFHTGMRRLFPAVSEAVKRLIDPASLRWISFSHFEADECGALHEWQTLAPQAEAVCSLVGKLVSVDDVVAARPVRGLDDGALLETGRYRFRFLRTPHVPHCWDASLLFEETQATLFCSDLFHQNGDVEALTSADIVDRFRQTLLDYEQGPFAQYMPYTHRTQGVLDRLADLRPRTLAAMHGSTFSGDGRRALQALAGVMRDVLGPS